MSRSVLPDVDCYREIEEPHNNTSFMALGAPLHLRVFLSSPGDVGEERRIARELIDEVARQPLLKGQVTFEVIAYDDPDAPPR